MRKLSFIFLLLFALVELTNALNGIAMKNEDGEQTHQQPNDENRPKPNQFDQDQSCINRGVVAIFRVLKKVEFVGHISLLLY